MDLQISINKESLTRYLKWFAKTTLVTLGLFLAVLLVNLFFAPIVFQLLLFVLLIGVAVLLFITILLAICVSCYKFLGKNV